MKRAVVFLLLAIFPASAYAQSSDAGDAGADTDALAAEIDRDLAQAMGSDCDTACRALDSMRRATDRLCALDPGDRCTRARQKLANATTRVRSACPSCAEPTGQALDEAAKAPPAPEPVNTAAQEETVQKKSGGCAGCTVGDAPTDAPSAAWLLALGLLLLRKKRASTDAAR
ncbi:MAG TPA: MYXO-CTERM sorting domain-containing protein [Polyangiaceae bacterium]